MATDNDADGIDLLRACKEGDLQKVQYYIEEKNISPTWNKKLIPEDLKRMDIPQNRGCSAIHFAAWYNHVDVLQYLVDCGVDVNLQQKYGSTPLHYAAWGGAIDAVQFLLTNFDINFKIVDQAGRVALHDAVDNGKLQILEYLISHICKKEEDRRWLRQLRDSARQTLMHHAVSTKNKTDTERQKIIAFLLQKNVCSLKAKNKEGHTPLTEACVYAKYDVVCQIANHYRELDRTAEGLRHDLTEALLTCARLGKVEMVSNIVEGQKLSILSADAFNVTAFHEAVKGGNVNMIEWLLNYIKHHKIEIATPVKEENEPAQCPTQTSSNSNNNFHTVKTILDLKEDSGRNLFHYAVCFTPAKHKKKVFDYLLCEGCEKPQNNPEIWADVERHCTKPLIKWLSEWTFELFKKDEPHKRKNKPTQKKGEDNNNTENVSKSSEESAKEQAIMIAKALYPLSKRRRSCKKTDIDEAESTQELTQLKEQVATMSSTIQTLQSHVSLLTQELELCKQTMMHMAPVQAPARIEVPHSDILPDELDFSNLQETLQTLESLGL